MTTDTAEATESEAGMDDVQRFHMVEDMVIFHNPHWEYLVNLALPVRPPTEAESARWAARYTDPDWREIYAPAEPRIVLAPSAEVAALLDPQQVPAEAEPEPAPPADLDDDAEKHMTKFLAAFAEDPEGDEYRAMPAEPEVHHDTQVIETPEVAG